MTLTHTQYGGIDALALSMPHEITDAVSCGPGTNKIALLYTASYTTSYIAIVNLADGTQIKSFQINLTGSQTAKFLSMLDTSGGRNLVACTSDTTYMYIVDLDQNTAQVIKSANEVYCAAWHPTKPQQMDGDVANGIALGTTNTYGMLSAIIQGQSIGFSAVYVPIPGLDTPTYNDSGSTKISTVLCKGPGTLSWILGTNNGRILDISLSVGHSPPSVSNVVLNSCYSIPTPKIYPQGGSYTQTVVSMHYHNGFLVVGCSDGFIYLFNHLTHQLIQKYCYMPRQSSGCGPIVSREGGISMITGAWGSSGEGGIQGIVEWDIFQSPMQQLDIAHMDIAKASYPRCVGIDGNYVWVCNNSTSPFVYFYTRAGARSVVNQTESASDVTNPTTAKSLHLSDPSLGNASVLFYTPILASGQDVPVTSGLGSRRIIKSAMIGTGLDCKFDNRRETS